MSKPTLFAPAFALTCALVATTTALVAPGCGSTSTNAPPGDTDSGAGADGNVPPAFVYSPAGCGYTVSPLDTWAFSDLAADDGAPVTDAAGGVPIRVRLGLGGKATAGQAGYADPTTTAVVTWETTAANHAAKVRLSTDATTLSDVHAGYTWTATVESGLGSGEPPVHMHEVHICGLTPGKTYFYQAGGGTTGSDAWGPTQSFTTVPSSGTITFGFSGDSRDNVLTLQAVQRRMRDNAVNFQLYSGDFIDIGALESFYASAFDAIWKDPADATKFLTLGQQMFIPIAGNHEQEASRFFSNFSLPAEGPYAKTYASFNAGSGHFVLIDDQMIALAPAGDQAAAQLAWLDGDLAKADADRAAHPFVVVVSHRGLYSTSEHHTDSDVVQARTSLATLYDKYHVDVALNGHEHEYESTHALKASATVPDGQGTVYIVNGGAGSEAYTVSVMDPRRRQQQFFGGTTMLTGTYGIATLDAHKLSLASYAMKSSSTTLANDKLIETIDLTR